MNRQGHCVTRLKGFLLIAALVVGSGVQFLSAQVTIPQGSSIDSAYLHVYVSGVNNRPVTVHRITHEWAETVVTYNSFGNSFAAASEGGFTADSIGWKTVDLTSLVQAWALGPMAGGFDNFGIALVELDESGSSTMGLYWSSEYGNIVGDPTLRPKLVIGYTPPGGTPITVTIQRPGIVAEQVVDTMVSAIEPDTNFGTNIQLLTRHYNGKMKYSLIRFIFVYTPSTCPGTGTPGYWMNHPEAWLDDIIVIGGIQYDKSVAIELMKMSVSGDKTYTMFAALVAAKLNGMLGCSTSCIATTITEADAWMYAHPVGSGVAAGGKDSPWRIGEPLYFMLDQYNNGLLCVPSRDFYEY